MTRRADNYLLRGRILNGVPELCSQESKRIETQENPLQKSNKEQSTKREQEEPNKKQREFPALLTRRPLVFLALSA
jgi:hypothetical protein